MLTPDYYDGSRLELFKKLEHMFKSNLANVEKVRDVSASLITDRLLIDKKIYDFLEKRRPDLIPFLLVWCRDTKIIEKRINLRLKFPVIEGVEGEFTKEYNLDMCVLSSFWYHKLYTMTPDLEGFQKLEKIGGASFEFELYGQRSSIVDGQLKIVVDAVLAVDALVVKDSVKILAIGSSSPGGMVSGIAYDVIPYMVTNSSFRLYDPNTINCRYTIDTNSFEHRAVKFPYTTVDGYDLVLDDVWIEGVHRETYDPDFIVSSAPNYSYKKFPFEKGKGNSYYQVFKTGGFELRSVSRDTTQIEYRNLPIGGCPACIELKYCLKGNYSSEFFSRFMSAHKYNCMTGDFRCINEIGLLDVAFEEINPISERILESFFWLPWDSGGKLAQLNSTLLSQQDIIVSDELYLTPYIIRYARSILYIIDNRFFFRGDKKLLGFSPVTYNMPKMKGMGVNAFKAAGKTNSPVRREIARADNKKKKKYENLKI